MTGWTTFSGSGMKNAQIPIKNMGRCPKKTLAQLLFTQSNFVAQKSHLEELIASHGHICNFYPKYHYKLNFIEQYWGAAKLHYQNSPKTTDINEMEANMKACLDAVPLVQIQRCVIFSFTLVTQLISTYFEICESISSLY